MGQSRNMCNTLLVSLWQCTHALYIFLLGCVGDLTRCSSARIAASKSSCVGFCMMYGRGRDPSVDRPLMVFIVLIL